MKKTLFLMLLVLFANNPTKSQIINFYYQTESGKNINMYPDSILIENKSMNFSYVHKTNLNSIDLSTLVSVDENRNSNINQVQVLCDNSKDLNILIKSTDKSKIIISNILGKIIYNQEINNNSYNEIIINKSSLQLGLYIINISSEKFNFSYKFISNSESNYSSQIFDIIPISNIPKIQNSITENNYDFTCFSSLFGNSKITGIKLDSITNITFKFTTNLGAVKIAKLIGNLDNLKGAYSHLIPYDTVYQTNFYKYEANDTYDSYDPDFSYYFSGRTLHINYENMHNPQNITQKKITFSFDTNNSIRYFEWNYIYTYLSSVGGQGSSCRVDMNLKFNVASYSLSNNILHIQLTNSDLTQLLLDKNIFAVYSSNNSSYLQQFFERTSYNTEFHYTSGATELTGNIDFTIEFEN